MGARKKKRKQAKEAGKLAQRQRKLLRDLRSNRRRREKLNARMDKERAALNKLLVRGGEAGLAVEDLAEESGIDPIQADQVLEIDEDSGVDSEPAEELDADQPGEAVDAASAPDHADATDGPDPSATAGEIGEPVRPDEGVPLGGDNGGASEEGANATSG